MTYEDYQKMMSTVNSGTQNNQTTGEIANGSTNTNANMNTGIGTGRDGSQEVSIKPVQRFPHNYVKQYSDAKEQAAQEAGIITQRAVDAAEAERYSNSPQGKMDAANAQMTDLYNKIMGYGPYSYDPNSDSLYQFYKDQYINNGKRAMQDTMGQAAGLTGGYGSTYAESAAQQSYNNYLQQLNAMVPELEQNAYNRWSNGLSQLQTQYGLTGDYYNQLYAQQQADYQRLLADLQLKILPSEEDMLNAGFSAEEIAYWQKKLKSSGSGSKKKKTGDDDGKTPKEVWLEDKSKVRNS